MKDCISLNKAVVARILEICDERKVTVNKLCVDCGVEPSTITSIFYGKSKNPGVGTINELCDGLGITLFDFFNSDVFKTKLYD